MTGTVGLGRIGGIPLRAHWTLLLALPFFAWVMATGFFLETGQPVTGTALIWGGALAAFLFVSILLHELAHSLMARRFGVEVDSITLLPIGGISHFRERAAETPKELWISLVGPATNFVLAVPFFLADRLTSTPPPVGEFLQGAWTLNLILGAFNLFFPAFPMDGGRVLRALLAKRLTFLKATRIAAALGRVLAVALGILGFLLLPGGIWLVLIAFFLYVGATQEERGAAVQDLLAGLRVRDLMTKKPALLRPDQTVEEALELMLRTKHTGFPVADPDGKILGYFGLDEASHVGHEDRATALVGKTLNPNPATARGSEKVIDALHRLVREGEEHLLIMDGDRLSGLLGRTDIARALTILAVERAEPEPSLLRPPPGEARRSRSRTSA